jgi:hypothetical protein
MNIPAPSFPTPGDPPSLQYLSQPLTAEGTPSPTRGPLTADPSGNPGDIEYTSWMRLILPRIA